MKKAFLILFILVFLLTGCEKATLIEEEQSKDSGQTENDDRIENSDQPNKGGQPANKEDEKTEAGESFRDILTVEVGALDPYDLVFSGYALETVLPRKWRFTQVAPGEYIIYRDGKRIGEAYSGDADLTDWSVVDEELFETETGLIINAFVDKSASESRYRRRLYFSLQEYPWLSATISVSYEQLDENALYRIWRESKPSAVKNSPNYDCLWEVEEGETVLILGNSFIPFSQIGFTLRQMCEAAPYPIFVESVGIGMAQVGTQLAYTDRMQDIREGRYGCVFICGFYSEGEIENLRLLKEICDESDTPLVIFPAHNENETVIANAVASDDTLYYLPWRDEINVLIDTVGVDLWDMCYDDVHRHSTSLAGYVGAHMIYRAIFGEAPASSEIADSVGAEEKLGHAYVTTGVVTGNASVLVFP